jgi:hypothetical protein
MLMQILYSTEVLEKMTYVSIVQYSIPIQVFVLKMTLLPPNPAPSELHPFSCDIETAPPPPPLILVLM